MQAKLELEELSYLLNTVGAERVIGTAQSQLFPSNEDIRLSTLERGFEALKAHKWLVQVDRKIKTHTGLLMMVAALVEPLNVVLLTLYSSEGTRNIVGYYGTRQLVTELFRTEDGGYLLTQMGNAQSAVERLQQALETPLDARERWTPLTLPLDIFQQVIQHAGVDSIDAIEVLLRSKNIVKGDIEKIVEAVQSPHVIAKIDLISWKNREQETRSQLVFTRSDDDKTFMLRKNQASEDVTIQPIDQAELDQKIQKFWAS